MIDFTNATFTSIAIHDVGNKLRDEEISFSKEPVVLTDEELETILMKYMLTPFKGEEFFNFSHPSSVQLNEMYSYSDRIFEEPDGFFEQSKNIAKHLYEQSTHPKIKAGELYVILLKDCKVDGIFTEAVGIFKSETKDTFLKVHANSVNYDIEHEEGINVNKLDKGCIIFNTDKDNGFKVAIVDSGGSSEAQYWKNDFLGLEPCEDDYNATKTYLNLCKSFVAEKLGEDFKVERADQIEMMNNSISYFKKNEKFNADEFADEVIGDAGMIGAFNDYKRSYAADKEIQITEDFEISGAAVKKQARTFKSILKLDKNFHIYIHGDRELIEKGFDQSMGMSFYKVFFKEES